MSMKVVTALWAALLVCGPAIAAGAPKVDIHPIARTSTTVTGQPIVVPQNPNVVVSIATFPPGSRLPEHQHPGPHYVYVLEGVLTVVNTETNKTFDVKPGDFVVEMVDTWHYGINNGAVPVKLLVIDQLAAGVTGNMKLRP